MTEWEREREKQEFEKARAMYKPLNAAMSSRFVSAKSHDISHIGKYIIIKQELFNSMCEVNILLTISPNILDFSS